MRTLLITIALKLFIATAPAAQGLYTQLSGGLMMNTGIRSGDIRNQQQQYGNPAGEFTILADKKKWQAGASISIFHIRNRTDFLFEQYIVPDGMAREYEISLAAPAFIPYISGNYKMPVGKRQAYIFAGARLGYFFTAREKERYYPVYGMLNKQRQVVLRSQPCPVYGLQAGLATDGDKLFSTGATLSWQVLNTKATMNYTANYTLYDTYMVPHFYSMNIRNEILYNLQLYSIQVFLRIRLGKAEKPVEEVPKQENE